MKSRFLCVQIKFNGNRLKRIFLMDSDGMAVISTRFKELTKFITYDD